MTAVPKPGKGKSGPKRPTRDEFELEVIGERLVEAKQEDSEAVLTIWGRDEPVYGLIVEMDSRTKLVHVMKYGETVKVPFMDIMKVGSPE
ncbi:YolD-like family protein [Cohnella xylanilytica]|uniref:YolD-like family protein n=1 Tax=Cohnella xylanilytica TaxID=557555 RepID=A0A841TQ96_9BACL|nr:YolD-like family protein [Cohnella xylanilytica]MBB6689889.1 YolD-like family protein [Cohnella xylanilytica]